MVTIRILSFVAIFLSILTGMYLSENLIMATFLGLSAILITVALLWDLIPNWMKYHNETEQYSTNLSALQDSEL